MIVVIGVGISGVCIVVYLLKEGFLVMVFECLSIVGGIWYYDDCVFGDLLYFSNMLFFGDYEVF